MQEKRMRIIPKRCKNQLRCKSAGARHKKKQKKQTLSVTPLAMSRTCHLLTHMNHAPF